MTLGEQLDVFDDNASQAVEYVMDLLQNRQCRGRAMGQQLLFLSRPVQRHRQSRLLGTTFFGHGTDITTVLNGRCLVAEACLFERGLHRETALAAGNRNDGPSLLPLIKRKEHHILTHRGAQAFKVLVRKAANRKMQECKTAQLFQGQFQVLINGNLVEQRRIVGTIPGT